MTDTSVVNVSKTPCGCLYVFQKDVPLIDVAFITEQSSTNILAPDYQPIFTEDGAFYIVPENYESMADPKKVTELDALLAASVSNLNNAQVLLSFDDGGGYDSYKMSLTQFLAFVKTYIYTNILSVTMSGNTGQSDNLIDARILDGELNGQNINILAAIPVSGEQGVYVDTSTGDYEVYNLGTVTGAKLKITYSNA